jgi:hypothetical protein
MRQVNELSAPGNTPSLAEVRDKIEARYANALGQAELAQTSVEGRMLEVQKATLDVAGASRLDQIRAGMSGQTAVEGGTGAAGAIGPGTSSPSFEKTEQPVQRGGRGPRRLRWRWSAAVGGRVRRCGRAGRRGRRWPGRSGTSR